MDNIPPQTFQWDGEAMRPLHDRLADKHFVVGETYTLAPWEDRSLASHNHEFAVIAEAWKNLPENLATLYPTPEHLRKRALIEAGYYTEILTDAGSNAASLRVASHLRAIDEFSLAIVRGPMVCHRRPQSQSRRAMGKEAFQKSKQAVLDVVSAMIGVKPENISNEVGRAA